MDDAACRWSDNGQALGIGQMCDERQTFAASADRSEADVDEDRQKKSNRVAASDFKARPFSDPLFVCESKDQTMSARPGGGVRCRVRDREDRND